MAVVCVCVCVCVYVMVCDDDDDNNDDDDDDDDDVGLVEDLIVLKFRSFDAVRASVNSDLTQISTTTANTEEKVNE